MSFVHAIPSSIPYGPQLGPGWAKLGPGWAPVGPNWGPFGDAAWDWPMGKMAGLKRKPNQVFEN